MKQNLCILFLTAGLSIGLTACTEIPNLPDTRVTPLSGYSVSEYKYAQITWDMWGSPPYSLEFHIVPISPNDFKAVVVEAHIHQDFWYSRSEHGLLEFPILQSEQPEMVRRLKLVFSGKIPLRSRVRQKCGSGTLLPCPGGGLSQELALTDASGTTKNYEKPEAASKKSSDAVDINALFYTESLQGFVAREIKKIYPPQDGN